jgi:tRNA pseudouridine65 synthase
MSDIGQFESAAEVPAAAERVPLPICFEDADFIAVHKPAGQFVHRSQLDRSQGYVCLQQLRDQIGESVYPCHRLDRPTSGILLFARNELAHREISKAFAEGRVRKRYEAVVRGWVAESGRIDYPIRAERDERQHAPRPAVTHYQCSEHLQLGLPYRGHSALRLSCVTLIPETGRRHQLRRHMAHLRHPILGDTRHGDTRLNQFVRDTTGLTRLMLVAVELGFEHPFTGRPILLRCPPAEAYQSFLQAVRVQ